MFIWSYMLVFFAAFFNSIMDSTENFANFNKSIFKNLDQKFWLKEESWKYAKMIFGWRADIWHISKSAMIFCFAGAIILFRPTHQWWVHFISLGIIWNATFWLFYNKLFRIK